MEDKYITAKEVAELLQVTERTIRNYAKEFGGVKVAGMWRFKRETIDEMFATEGE